MKKLIVAIIIVIVAGTFDYLKKATDSSTKNTNNPTTSQPQTQSSNTQQQQLLEKIRHAAQNQQSGWWLETNANVIKILRDDTKGHAHQKFLIQLAPDITLLVAHNIDLAQRVPLKKGDSITLRGRYEWNNRGGVIHWTHHDPKRRKKGGWIQHNGQRYQ